MKNHKRLFNKGKNMVYNERDVRKESVLEAARKIMVAARTAPKAKGVDVIEVCTITGEDITTLSEEMRRAAEENGFKFFLRDADNILQAEAVVLIGTYELCQGLNCGRCGYDLCTDRKEGVPCAINSVDVGIAIGSACATAADLRIDTRVMHSAGITAMRPGMVFEGLKDVYAIPLSCKSKNPFFDRKPKEEQK